MHRTWAIIERELRRFRRSPMLIVMSLVMPIIQLIVLGYALGDLRNGHLNGVLAIPPDFSRRKLVRDDPRVALIEDNTDNFVSASLAGAYTGLIAAYNQPAASAQRTSTQTSLDIVEMY